MPPTRTAPKSHSSRRKPAAPAPMTPFKSTNKRQKQEETETLTSVSSSTQTTGSSIPADIYKEAPTHRAQEPVSGMASDGGGEERVDAGGRPVSNGQLGPSPTNSLKRKAGAYSSGFKRRRVGARKHIELQCAWAPPTGNPVSTPEKKEVNWNDLLDALTAGPFLTEVVGGGLDDQLADALWKDLLEMVHDGFYPGRELRLALLRNAHKIIGLRHQYLGEKARRAALDNTAAPEAQVGNAQESNFTELDSEMLDAEFNEPAQQETVGTPKGGQPLETVGTPKGGQPLYNPPWPEPWVPQQGDCIMEEVGPEVQPQGPIFPPWRPLPVPEYGTSPTPLFEEGMDVDQEASRERTATGHEGLLMEVEEGGFHWDGREEMEVESLQEAGNPISSAPNVFGVPFVLPPSLFTPVQRPSSSVFAPPRPFAGGSLFQPAAPSSGSSVSAQPRPISGSPGSVVVAAVPSAAAAVFAPPRLFWDGSVFRPSVFAPVQSPESSVVAPVPSPVSAPPRPSSGSPGPSVNAPVSAPPGPSSGSPGPSVPAPVPSPASSVGAPSRPLLDQNLLDLVPNWAKGAFKTRRGRARAPVPPPAPAPAPASAPAPAPAPVSSSPSGLPSSSPASSAPLISDEAINWVDQAFAASSLEATGSNGPSAPSGWVGGSGFGSGSGSVSSAVAAPAPQQMGMGMGMGREEGVPFVQPPGTMYFGGKYIPVKQPPPPLWNPPIPPPESASAPKRRRGHAPSEAALEKRSGGSN
ncbi:hypothetical protein DFH27DRAFT_600219 [Peziza echinospora]|nr:hypothetical protein DFH27DRAFT_600219 [Peziza echinospora]